jgi:peptidoglycan/LPS O-acetylase OafA/YrhL
MSKGYLPTLDGWRSGAITLVLLCHAFSLAGTDGRINSLILNLGQQGVSLFFAISGYLITTLLLDEQKLGGISLSRFYIRRAFRILPPAYIYLAGVAILGISGLRHLTSGEILSSALVYNNYWPQRSWLTQHFWSLSMEEHFYLLWPSLLALSGLVRAKWFAVAGIIGTLLWRPWSVGHVHLNVPALQRTDMRLDAFLWACLLAILVHSQGRIHKVICRVQFHVGIMILMATLYAIALAHPMQLTKLAVQSALMPLVVVPTVFLPNYGLSRLLEWRPLRWIGKISYGLYLWQQLLFHGDASSLLTAAKVFPLKMAGLLAITTVSYYLIESPLIRSGRKLASGRRTQVPSAVIAQRLHEGQ